METFRRDLAKAGIPYFDGQGRRVDLHALRVTFGTNLVLSGAHPRVAQELMRHSDIRLTMKIYTNASKLPLAEGVAGLPTFELRNAISSYSKNPLLKIGNG
jgi:site-specific recombinase XerD